MIVDDKITHYLEEKSVTITYYMMRCWDKQI